MWVVVKVQTSTNNSTGSSALVRVDTMVPKLNMVILRHSVSVSSLETQRSESIIYVVNDETADNIDGIEGTKSFMSQDTLLSILRESSDGTPSSVLTTANFATFPVTSVHAATGESSSESDTSWPQTTVGIAVLSTIGASILLLAIILVTYFLCTRGRQYK
ncbi:hypothetical protein FSP39_011842 [Pinctada imbricata]|uniref:Uncharacterized protein n=1 Tax=Pinctada imbricata TaxID=66713 RepID=A0AA88YQW8_PINIB|nr:hypothetical protein FSP39_011842 [Pinctada imbricata]